MNRQEIDSKIRKLKLDLINNLDDKFNPIDEDLDGHLEKELSALYKERSKSQVIQMDSLSKMYLYTYH